MFITLGAASYEQLVTQVSGQPRAMFLHYLEQKLALSIQRPWGMAHS